MPTHREAGGDSQRDREVLQPQRHHVEQPGLDSLVDAEQDSGADREQHTAEQHADTRLHIQEALVLMMDAFRDV